MASQENERPSNYSVSPGAMLKEYLEVRQLSQAEFARRCGRSPKLISEIVSGKASLEPKTAIQFERVLGLSANIWLGFESGYRLRDARRSDIDDATADGEWSKGFPVRELTKRGCFERPKSDADTVLKLLAFFGVGSIQAWTNRYSNMSIAYRHSPSFDSNEFALTTWLRLGELEAERQDYANYEDCASCQSYVSYRNDRNYDESKFKRALRQIRNLTREPVDDALKQAGHLCHQAGVALALVPLLPKVSVSGAAWWPSRRNAIIQLSGRHRSDDHLWFSFFHEAAHILLHGKNNVFIDDANPEGNGLEREANEWASDTLVPRNAWKKFSLHSHFSVNVIQEFAYNQGIAPGIVVGRLQHEKIIPWNKMNHLKVKLRLTR